MGRTLLKEELLARLESSFADGATSNQETWDLGLRDLVEVDLGKHCIVETFGSTLTRMRKGKSNEGAVAATMDMLRRGQIVKVKSPSGYLFGRIAAADGSFTRESAVRLGKEMGHDGEDVARGYDKRPGLVLPDKW